MNRKAQSKILWNNISKLIILILFVAGIYIFISGQLNGAFVWSDEYSKEISKVINLASPGDKIELDVHKATSVALNNEVPLNEIFSFDNTNNEICVKLSRGRQTCYSYFNNVDIINPQIKLAQPNKNILTFQIAEKPEERNV